MRTNGTWVHARARACILHFVFRAFLLFPFTLRKIVTKDTCSTTILATEITILATEIKPVGVTKDLGVHIDCYLNCNEHITKTASDCMFKLTRVNRIKHLLGQRTLIYLIKAFVFCKLFYCSTVWNNTSKENIRKLQFVQNYACRIVTGLNKYDHISEALKSFKWLNVKGKLLFIDLVMVYKCMNNLTPDYLRERFQHRSEIYQRDTRQKNDQTLPKGRISTGQRAFAYRGVKMFTRGDQKHKKP